MRDLSSANSLLMQHPVPGDALHGLEPGRRGDERIHAGCGHLGQRLGQDGQPVAVRGAVPVEPGRAPAAARPQLQLCMMEASPAFTLSAKLSTPVLVCVCVSLSGWPAKYTVQVAPRHLLRKRDTRQ